VTASNLANKNKKDVGVALTLTISIVLEVLLLWVLFSVPSIAMSILPTKYDEKNDMHH
jgi:hypothetical protein